MDAAPCVEDEAVVAALLKQASAIFGVRRSTRKSSHEAFEGERSSS